MIKAIHGVKLLSSRFFVALIDKDRQFDNENGARLECDSRKQAVELIENIVKSPPSELLRIAEDIWIRPEALKGLNIVEEIWLPRECGNDLDFTQGSWRKVGSFPEQYLDLEYLESAYTKFLVVGCDSPVEKVAVSCSPPKAACSPVSAKNGCKTAATTAEAMKKSLLSAKRKTKRKKRSS